VMEPSHEQGSADQADDPEDASAMCLGWACARRARQQRHDAAFRRGLSGRRINKSADLIEMIRISAQRIAKTTPRMAACVRSAASVAEPWPFLQGP